MPEQTILDAVAQDLAAWLDQTSGRIAAAMAPQGTAPFAAQMSEQQKIEYYTRQLFNRDGSPNTDGRAQQMQRLGPQGFTQVYKAVIQAHPELRPATPEEPAAPAAPAEAVPMPAGPIAPDGLPTRPAEPAASVPMPSGPIAPDGLPTRTG